MKCPLIRPTHIPFNFVAFSGQFHVTVKGIGSELFVSEQCKWLQSPGVSKRLLF